MRKRQETPLLSLASVAAVAVSVVGGGMTAAVVVVVAFNLHHAKNKKIFEPRLGASAYFGADLRGARWAAVVPFGTAFFFEVGAGTASEA